jgi:RNA polymerase-binding transcription factor DksA
LSQTLANKLRAIEEALQQAQQGRYGLCERCGNPIDPARLEILPETTFCTACKRVVEQQMHLNTKTRWS